MHVELTRLHNLIPRSLESIHPVVKNKKPSWAVKPLMLSNFKYPIMEKLFEEINKLIPPSKFKIKHKPISQSTSDFIYRFILTIHKRVMQEGGLALQL